MRCDYFDAGACRSCSLMGVGYAVQLADKQAAAAAVLAEEVPGGAWARPVGNQESGFRNRAKLVVGGTKAAPTLGILDQHGRGVDLRHCGLHEPALHRAVRALAGLLPGAGLTPYDVPSRQGELKNVLVTVSPDEELMVRFVLRSPGQLSRVRELHPRLRDAVPGVRVLSVNLQPEHKAVLEGPEEILLTDDTTLPIRVAGLTLHLGTRSFFQTSTQVADALYRQVAAWVEDAAPRTLWDLYCGVGGFALVGAGTGDREVLGVEISPEAVRSARRSADELGLAHRVRFETGDATASLQRRGEGPEALVVNPPRRGIGERLARRVEESTARTLVYSSCNPRSLAADLARMPSWRVERARLFDMFPQSRHSEVAVLLSRRGAVS